MASPDPHHEQTLSSGGVGSSAHPTGLDVYASNTRVSLSAGDTHPLAGPSPVSAIPVRSAVSHPGQGTTAGTPDTGLAVDAPLSTFPPLQTPALTRPGDVVSPNQNPMDDFADEFLSGPSYRTEQLGLPPIVRPSPLPREDGILRLRTLVARRAWGDVLKLSSNMLTGAGQYLHADVYGSLVTLSLNEPHGTDVSMIPLNVRLETVEIMMLQCNAWLKLRRYTDLATEVERWNFLTQNDATATSPNWLPWNIHVLAGQALEYTEDAPRATDILYNLRQRIPSTEPGTLARLDNALANIFLRRGKWRLALASLDRVVELIPAAVEVELKSKKYSASQTLEADMILCLTKIYMCEILSRQGRIFLQAGVLLQAAEIFESAKVLWNEVEGIIPEELGNHESVKLMPCQMEVNEALFHFSKSRYDHAIQSFSRAVDWLQKTNNFHTRYRPDEWLGPSIMTCEAPNVLYSEAINNMALCHLYMCNMKEAVDLLEKLVRHDPAAFLTERVAFNLSTLYELGSDSATGTKKKRVLQLIAKRFFLHDVGPESFRVT